MPEAPALNKKNKLKKISKEMFSWSKENICDGLVAHKSDNVEMGSILVSIPKNHRELCKKKSPTQSGKRNL